MSSLPDESPRDAASPAGSDSISAAPPPERGPEEPIEQLSSDPLDSPPAELAAQSDAFLTPHVEPHAAEPEAAASTLFQSFTRPEAPPAPRIPNLLHVLILVALLIMGWVAGGLISQTALHFHLFGVTTTEEANSDIHYTLGNEVIIDLFTLTGCLLIFPPLWHKGFFNGIAWRRSRARRRRTMLIGAAFLCFLLALVNGWLMPGPTDAPIDQMFRIPGAAWLLFAFAITFAPVFEEIAFRGFLLPALCTACDWIGEKISGNPPPPLDSEGQPRWSIAAMITGSILTSIPFAGMHVPQTGYSLGPFLLLICVSLVLCWARLGTRSLGASVLVHASYNFMLFLFMFLGTSGFRHMENM